jgi:hypothetical protein
MGNSLKIKVKKFEPTPCEDVTYNITRDGLPFASGSEPSGGDISIDVPSDCPTPEPCEDANISLNEVAFESIPSGESRDIPILNTALTPIGYKDIDDEIERWIIPDTNIRNSDNTFNQDYESGSEQTLPNIDIKRSDDSLIENIPSVKDYKVADSEISIRKSDNTLIENVPVKAADTTPYLVADSVITLNDTTPTLISTTNVKATDNATIVAPDGVVTITDTTPTTLHTVNVKSNGVASQQISDSTVNVQKSDNTLIAAVNVKAQGAEPYNVADSVVNVNSVKLADVKATDTLNITVVDSLDAAVSVTLSGGNKIIVDDLPCSGGTCAEAYQSVNHATLNRNNPFGNTNRFTAPDGTQTYTDGIVLDWYQADDNARTVPMYGVSLIASANLATQLSNEPYTVGAYNDFMLIEVEDLFALVNPRASAIADSLNYSPFNHQATSAATAVRSKTDYYNDTTQNHTYLATGAIAPAAKTSNRQSIITRMATYTELGL